MQARKLKLKDGQELPKAAPLGRDKARLGPRSSHGLLVALSSKHCTRHQHSDQSQLLLWEATCLDPNFPESFDFLPTFLMCPLKHTHTHTLFSLSSVQFLFSK